MKSTHLGLILIPIFALVLSACGKSNVFDSISPSYSAEEDQGFVQNAYGQRVSWKGQTPIPLVIHESVPSQFYPAITAAIKSWETALGKPLFRIVQFGAKGPLQPREDGANIVYWMDAWEANRTTEQARTSVRWVGDEIREADIRINAKNFSFYVTTPKDSRDVHFESLMVHELGHVLGLKHKDTGGSVMATYLSSVEDRSQVSKTDIESIHFEY